MQNEALSVSDPRWSATVLRHLRMRGVIRAFWTALVVLALCLLLLAGRVALLRVGWHMDQNPVGSWLMVNTMRFDVLMIGAVVAVGALLRRVGLRPAIAALALATTPVVLWALGKVLYIRGEWKEYGVQATGVPTVNLADFPLTPSLWLMFAGCAGFGLLGAWLVGRRTSS